MSHDFKEGAASSVLPLRNSESASVLSTASATRQRKGAKQINAEHHKIAETYLKENDKFSVWSIRRFVGILRSRQFWSRETLIKIFRWIRQYPRLTVGIVLFIGCILRPSLTWKWYYTNFGGHYLNGGTIGRRLERWSMRKAFDKKLRKEEERMRKIGIMLPPKDNRQDEPFRELNLKFDTAYHTLLIQRETRALALATIEKEADLGVVLSIPEIVFVPQTLHWVPPRPTTFRNLQRIPFDDQERRQAVIDVCPDLGMVYDKFDNNDRIHLWALCMVYYYGGVFFGDRIQSPSSVGVMKEITGRETAFGKVHFSSKLINGLVASPRHPIIKCFLDRVGQVGRLTDLTDILFLGHDENKSMQLQCSVGSADCCRNFQVAEASTSKSKIGMVSLMVTKEPLVDTDRNPQSNTRVTIAKPRWEDAKMAKISIDSELRKQRIQPSWFCMRCLMMPTYGRVSTCTRFCSPAYSDFVCRPAENTVVQEVEVSVTAGSQPDVAQIPKIVHQTWFEDVDLDRYPQLGRVQNSWKNTGWEYRLYTDETAKTYILENFPPIFAEAFDALLPGAYKADFFRYLVLMKEGGVYADVDVLLETNLDHLIRPGLSFFVPRDVVAEYGDEAFCLWNGLIGAAPGHPVIIRAVERLVNHIVERADVQDMERQICQKDKDTEIWKIHNHKILLLSGPCSLGIAMNEALGRTSLHAINIGWTSLILSTESGGEADYGDALIMVLDKHDLGGFRFSDPDRNILIASTDLQGAEKIARDVANPSNAERQRRAHRQNRVHGHYSKAARGTYVWGSQGIYKDNLVSKFRIKFLVTYG